MSDVSGRNIRDLIFPFDKSELASTVGAAVRRLWVAMEQELRVGKILRRLMEDQAETRSSVSKATGVPKSTISEWMNNRAPNPVQAVKVANHLDVSLHYLLFGQDDSMEPIQRILKEDFFKGIFEISIKRVKIREN